MAAIHALPVRLDGAASRRLIAELEACIAAGADPGPRVHQIEVLRQSLHTSLRALSVAFASVADALPPDDPGRRAAEMSIQRFVQSVENLIADAEASRAARPGIALIPAA
ncbi:hypothetical protein [Methylobacterium sp. P5_C11]